MGNQLGEERPERQRRRDIDWLRFVAVLLLFPFHTARIFDGFEEFYVKSDQASTALTWVVAYLAPWHMRLFFALAGASTWFALRVRGGGAYAKERAKRLLVPFLFGLLVLIPPQSYLGLVSHSDDPASFIEWYPRFFRLIPEDVDGYFLGGHTWGHLWFIVHLLVYSLAALPLFLYLRSEAGRPKIGRLALLGARRRAILPLGVLLLVANGFPKVAGGNPLAYLLFFVFGYLVVADSRFEQAIDANRRIALALGPVPLIAVAYLHAAGWPADLPAWGATLLRVYAEGFIPWLTVIAALGYGRRYLSFGGKLLSWASQASYPLYTIHQTVIVVVGFYVVRWATEPAVRFLAIGTASLFATAVAYDVLVRRTRVTRFLFGLRPNP